jgi:hypothetical protein
MAEPISNPGTNTVSSGYRLDAGAPRYILLQVRYDEAKLRAMQRALKGFPGAMSRAVPSALNKTAKEMQTWLRRALSHRVRIRRIESLNDRVRAYPVQTANGSSGVLISLTRFTMASFLDVIPMEPGVYFAPYVGRAGQIIPRSFIQYRYRNFQSGQRLDVAQVYRRAQRGEKGFAEDAINRAGHRVRATRRGDIVQRYSLKLLRGPSLGMVFSKDPGLIAAAEKQGAEILDKKFQSQIDRFTLQVVS